MNLRETLRRRIKAAGGLRRLARQLDVDAGYLCRVVSGQQEPGPQILDALGLTREIAYRKNKC